MVLGDFTLAQRANSVARHNVHADHLNTPRRITRLSDNVIIWRWDSDPFGTTVANENPDGDANQFTYHLRFPGQYGDMETGLHYNYFRDYDPTTGRYIESDPIGLTDGVNTYSYVRTNPITSTDPTGEFRVTSETSLGRGDGGGVFCDGKGGLEVKLSNTWSDCTRDCVMAHERSHVTDIRVRNPGLCRNISEKRRIAPSSVDEHRWTELRAYEAELQCLRNKLENECEECEAIIRQQMTDARNHLLEFRR